MIYPSSISAFVVLACVAFLAIEAAPLQNQLIQLHPISRSQYESFLDLAAYRPASVQARHINYTTLNPLNGWSNDISHGWNYLLNKTGLYQKPAKLVRDRGYKLCYVNPVYGGPNAGEGVMGRSIREASAEARVSAPAIEEDEEDEAVDSNGKPIAVQYFPNPGVTCVWVRPEPEEEEEEGEEGGGETGGVPAVAPQFYPPSSFAAAAGAYPYPSASPYPNASPYPSAYAPYPYASPYSSPYAAPYDAPYATPYAYGRSDAKSNKKTASISAIVEQKPQHLAKPMDKSKDQGLQQKQQQPIQKPRQYGAFGYGSPYGSSYGSPYGGGYYGGGYGGGYGAGYGSPYGSAYGSPYGGINPYAGLYGGQSFGYPGYGHYDNEDSGEDTEDSEGSEENSGETDESYDNEHGHESGYGGEEEDDE